MANKWETLNNLYIKRGLKIFPVIENKKIPRISAWNKDCSCDLYQVLYYYENHKTGNWGLPCYENNLFVIDLDRHDVDKDGVVYFDKLCKDLGIPQIDTMKQETPSGGVHLIFQSNDILRNVEGVANAFKDYPGIDLRNKNYILVEPSVINNKPYRFCNNLPPMPMPVVLQQYILDNVGTKTDNKKTPYVKPKEVSKGDRDNQLFQYINQIYFKTKLDFEEVLVLANYFNDEILEEPFSKKDVEYKVRKAFEKDRAECIVLWLGEK